MSAHDALSSDAVTVLIPPLSEIDACDSDSVTVSKSSLTMVPVAVAVKSSVVVATQPKGSWPVKVRASRLATMVSSASRSSFSAVATVTLCDSLALPSNHSVLVDMTE